MILADICLGFILLGITAYAVRGSADFGAGFWDLTAGGAQRGAQIVEAGQPLERDARQLRARNGPLLQQRT